MKELFRERDLAQIHFYRGVLDEAGIETFIRNENLSSIQGVAIPDYFPALCVVQNADYGRAVELIKNRLSASEEIDSDTTCAQCGETVHGNFDHCWSCEAAISR